MAAPPPPPSPPPGGGPLPIADLDSLIAESQAAINRLEELQKTRLTIGQRLHKHFSRQGHGLVQAMLAGSVLVVAVSRLGLKNEYQARRWGRWARRADASLAAHVPLPALEPIERGCAACTHHPYAHASTQTQAAKAEWEQQAGRLEAERAAAEERLGAVVAAGDVEGCQRFVDHGARGTRAGGRRERRHQLARASPPLPCAAVLSDSVPLALSRQLLLAFAQSLAQLQADTHRAVAT